MAEEANTTTVSAKRFKVQTTTRVTNELQWADEDNRTQIIEAIQLDQAAAIGRVHAASAGTALGGVRKGAAADNEGKARAQTVYDAYRDLGGNGHGTQINQDIQNMPIAPSEPTRPSPAIRRGNFIPTQPGRRPMGKPKNKSRPAKAALATLVAMLLALTPATAMADMHGIDVSGWQSDTATCAAPGDFAIVKVTGGTYFTNPRWRAQADCTLRSGKALGLHGHERHRPRRRHDQRHRPYHRRHHRRKRPQGPRR